MEINQGILATVILAIIIIGLGYNASVREERRNPKTKRCKHCDEEIRIKALICKYCGSSQE